MRALIWTFRAIVFLLLFGFAVKNTETVSLRFFLDTVWQVPLVVLLFAFFAGGALMALLAVSGGFFRLRREVARLRKQGAAPAATPMPAPDVDRT